MNDGPAVPPGMLPVATVSVLDVFTKVVEMQVELAKINERLADVPDHEVRLRVLEQAKAKVYGGAAVIAAVMGSGAGWVVLAVAHH
jgi:hypothetical protein